MALYRAATAVLTLTANQRKVILFTLLVFAAMC